MKKIPNKKYHLNENYFNIINNEEKSYWLGFLYADGNVRMYKNRSGILTLKLAGLDKNHIKKFNKCIDSDYKIKDNKYKNYSILSIYNTKMVKDLYKLGCVNNKTQKIRLPKLDLELMRHFIRGYFDGDGCISKIKNGINCYSISITSNINFILDLKKYIDSIFSCDLNFYESKNKKYSTLLISDKKNRYNFYNYIYNNSSIYLKRKKDIFNDMIVIKDVNRKGKTNIKIHKIISPNGEIFFSNNGLSEFCRNYNLNYSSINNILRGSVNNYKGWKIEY